MRVVQYWSRFFAFYLLQKGYTKDTVKFWSQIKSSIGLSRKLFRVGKPLANAKEAIAIWQKKTGDPIVRATSFIRAIGYAIYLTSDTCVWLNGTKIYTVPHFDTVKKVGTHFWMLGIFCNIIKSLRRHQLATEKEKILLASSEKNTVELQKLAAEKHSANVQFVWDCLDITNPLSGLKYVDLDDGIVGFAGFITGILGVRKQWAATA